MKPKISILCATRGRPNNVLRLIESIKKTAADLNSVELLLRVDKDDTATQNLESLIPTDLGYSVRVLRDVQTSISDSWNDCWRAATGEIYFLCGDDIVFSSPAWDDRVRESFEKYPDRIVLVFGKDGLFEGRFASHPFVHKNWTDAVGYFTPPGYMCRNDLWLWEMASDIGRTEYNGQVYTEHMHYEMKKATLDASYQLMRTRYDNETSRYNIEAQKRIEGANKLRAAFKIESDIVDLKNREEFWSKKSIASCQGNTTTTLLEQKAYLFAQRTAMEIGPGDGRQSNKVIHLCNNYCVADICQEVLNNELYAKTDKFLIQSYLSDIGRKFDFIHFWYVVHHLLPEELNKFFGFVRRHLNVNGQVFFNYPDSSKYQTLNLANDGINTSSVSKDDLNRILSKHFEIITQVPEGPSISVHMKAK